VIRTIVVGVDGSDDAQRALQVAVDLAEPVGGEVVAVHARGLLERFTAGPVERPTCDRDALRERFETEWCRILDDRGIPGRRVLREGAPVVVLLEVAREVDADLVVVGRRGAGARPGGAILGSTSAQVVDDADRPVVVVPVPGGPARA
jgi:nucleotide-binding universal stress UspA family protein